ncbi:hypothetical protein [Streptomyces sp. NPDC058755]|uniref:hypothetical protein n=1 Tax=Streptomyces sp. NPDC058755 TaxID=3346624 RepID=UPI0036C71207
MSDIAEPVDPWVAEDRVEQAAVVTVPPNMGWSHGMSTWKGYTRSWVIFLLAVSTWSAYRSHALASWVHAATRLATRGSSEWARSGGAAKPTKPLK